MNPANPFVRRGLIFIFMLLGIAVYAQSFHAGFQMDDMTSIVENDVLKDFFHVSQIWQYDHSRFLPHLSFALNYHFHHSHVFGYHAVNFILHLLNSFLVMILARLILAPSLRANTVSEAISEIASSASPPRNDVLAYFSGLIFLVHPLQTGAVTYIVQRATLIGTFFYLLTLIFFLLGRRKNQVFYIVTAFIFAVAAMFSKPIAFTLPFAVIVCDVFFAGGKIRDFKCWVLYLPFFAIFIYTLVPHYTIKAVMGQPLAGPGALDQRHYLLTQINVLRTYLRLLVLPIHQNLDYDYPVAKSFWEWKTLASFCFLTAMILLGLKLFRKHRVFSFGILWFFLTLSVESSVYPLKDVIFEHRLYLPMAGFSLMVPYAIYYFFKDVKKTCVILTLAVLALSVLTYKRNGLWADDLRLWQDTVQKSPAKARPYNNLGLVYLHRNDTKKALEYFQKAIERDPKYALVYHNIGLVYERQKDYEKAAGYYHQAIELEPYTADFYNSLGSVTAAMGPIDQAMKYYEKAIELYPGYAEAHKNLGWLYQGRRDWRMARYHYEKAIGIDPQFAAAYNGIGYILGEVGQYTQAIAFYERALKMGGVSAQALSNLSFLYNQLGFSDAALQYASKAIAMDAKNSEAYNNLGIAYAQKGNLDVAIENFRKAITLQPDYAEAHMNLGAAYGIKGDFKKEIASYEEAIRLKPDYAQAYYNLGYSYEQQGKRKEAVGAYQKVIQIVPNHNNAHQALTRLELSRKS